MLAILHLTITVGFLYRTTLDNLSMSNFSMGTILGKGFPQAQVHTVHECLRKILSQDCPHGEIAFFTSLCIYNVVYFATYVFITNKKKLVKLQYVVVYYGGMIL